MSSAAALFEPLRSWLSSESLQSFVSQHTHSIIALKKNAPVGEALKVGLARKAGCTACLLLRAQAVHDGAS